jgi:hypothetical protein
MRRSQCDELPEFPILAILALLANDLPTVPVRLCPARQV